MKTIIIIIITCVSRQSCNRRDFLFASRSCAVRLHTHAHHTHTHMHTHTYTHMHTTTHMHTCTYTLIRTRCTSHTYAHAQHSSHNTHTPHMHTTHLRCFLLSADNTPFDDSKLRLIMPYDQSKRSRFWYTCKGSSCSSSKMSW